MGIFWIIIIIWIVIAVSKNKNKNSNSGQKKTNNTQSRPTPSPSVARTSSGTQNTSYRQPQGDSWEESQRKQRELKHRLSQKYNQQQSGDILQRAKASVEEDFSEKNTGSNIDEVPSVTSNTEPVGFGAGMEQLQYRTSEDKQDWQKEMERRVAEKMAADVHVKEESDVLSSVEDMMIKGPDTGISFERDFLAEGIDMLNQIQA